MFKVPELRRVTSGPFATGKEDGNNGCFRFPINGLLGVSWFNVICEETPEWEHVSVTKLVKGKTFTPSWEEMCMIKDEFWDEEDECFQFHPKKSEYVNLHPNLLHIWRPGKDAPSIPSPTYIDEEKLSLQGQK